MKNKDEIAKKNIADLVDKEINQVVNNNSRNIPQDLVDKEIKIIAKENSVKYTREKVSPEEVLRNVGPDSVSVLSAIQKAGMSLIWAVGGLIGLILLFIFIDLIVTSIMLFTVYSSKGLVTDLDVWNSISNIGLNRVSNLFDSIIVKGLLPVFTTILGYIFGSQSNSKTDNRKI